MSTTTKRELIDRVSEETGERRALVQKVIQSFLNNIICELGNGNRLEFRDFGVFEPRERPSRTAQNPRTMETVVVPRKATIRFKPGQLMRDAVDHEQAPEKLRVCMERSTDGVDEAVARISRDGAKDGRAERK